MVKNALKKADVPFKAIVHSNTKGEDESILASGGVRDPNKTFAVGNKVTII